MMLVESVDPEVARLIALKMSVNNPPRRDAISPMPSVLPPSREERIESRDWPERLEIAEVADLIRVLMSPTSFSMEVILAEERPARNNV